MPCDAYRCERGHVRPSSRGSSPGCRRSPRAPARQPHVVRRGQAVRLGAAVQQGRRQALRRRPGARRPDPRGQWPTSTTRRRCSQAAPRACSHDPALRRLRRGARPAPPRAEPARLRALVIDAWLAAAAAQLVDDFLPSPSGRRHAGASRCSSTRQSARGATILGCAYERGSHSASEREGPRRHGHDPRPVRSARRRPARPRARRDPRPHDERREPATPRRRAEHAARRPAARRSAARTASGSPLTSATAPNGGNPSTLATLRPRPPASARDHRRARTARRGAPARASAGAVVRLGRVRRRGAPRGPAVPRPAGRPARGARTAPGPGRGTRRSFAGTRCSTASVPTTTGASGTVGDRGVEPRDLGPGQQRGQRVAEPLHPEARGAQLRVRGTRVQIVGRVVPQRGHVSRPGSDSITAASHRSHVATVEQLRQVRSFARPLRLSTHTARSPASTVRCSARPAPR